VRRSARTAQRLLPPSATTTCVEERERGKAGRDRERDNAGGEKKAGRQGKIRQKERKNRGEREMELPKDLCANSENCKGLSVKQNFPSI
jgi:hypothetical protein